MPLFDKSYKIRVSARAIVFDEDRVLLNRFGDGAYYNFPGGSVVQDVLGHADVTLTLNTYSHVIGTTAHDQMSKINGLFNDVSASNKQQECDKEPVVYEKPAKKPSLKEKMDAAKKEVKANEKKSSSKQKYKAETEL